ncbi:MAG: D-alanyl-D-alanine carboxypeptidase family protein [Actinomycetota bacterium]
MALALESPVSPSSAPSSALVSMQTREGERRRPPRQPSVGCEACVVISDNGKTLFRRNADAELPNASTTKMMTALLTVRAGVMGEEVRVSANAANAGGGVFDLNQGEVWSVDALLAALLLSSSNDAASALAEHVSESEDAFVETMNDQARRLGLDHTAFVTPHGLDVEGHYSSAADLAVVAEELLEEPPLRRMVARPEATIEGPEGAVTIENSNLLLESYRGSIGVKTGYTLGAGNALVSSAVRGERRLIGVVLRSADAFADSSALLDYGFARLRRSVLLQRGAEVGTVVLDPAGSVRAHASRTVRGLAPPDTIEVSFEPAPSYDLPLTPREVVGSVIVTSGERVVDRVPAMTRSRVEEPQPSWAAEGLATVLSWGQWMGN